MTNPTRPAEVAVPRRAWIALAVLLAGMFMSLLDTTIVNVALPTIRTSIDASESTLSWIISGYALAFGHSATVALLISAIFAVVAFFLVFTLPKKISRQGAPMPE